MGGDLGVDPLPGLVDECSGEEAVDRLPGNATDDLDQAGHRVGAEEPLTVDVDELIGHQRQARQLRNRIAAVDVAVDLPGKLPVEGIAGGAVADHRGAERADLLDGDEPSLEEPGRDQRQRSPEAVPGDPDGTVAVLHLRFDRRQEDRPDRRDRVDEALVEAGPDASGGEVEAQTPLRHDEEIHRVGEEDVLEPVEARRALRPPEGNDDVVGAGPQPGLGVVDAEEPRVEGEDLLKGLLPFRLAEVGQGA